MNILEVFLEKNIGIDQTIDVITLVVPNLDSFPALRVTGWSGFSLGIRAGRPAQPQKSILVSPLQCMLMKNNSLYPYKKKTAHHVRTYVARRPRGAHVSSWPS
jgi:hypothetical protein